MAPRKKRAARREEEEEEEEEEEKSSSNAERCFRGVSDAPVANKAPKVAKGEERRLIVILEGAMLETVKQGKTFELLNCDRHRGTLAKAGRDPGMARPDITHQCLLMLQDSPLNRAGMLQVFVHTQRNALVAIAPQTRIPRTFERFSGLMVQLLHKLNVRNADGKQKLLKVIKNPVTSHLPPGCIKVATSFHADGEPVHPRTLANDDRPIAVVVGAFAHGSVNVDYTEQTVSLSSYPLSAALTCTKLCSAFEEVWGVH